MSVESPQSDAQLLHAVRGGNATAYRLLRERHAAAARALAGQFVRDEEEIEDVVAEAFTRVLDEVGRGGGPESAFRTYLLGVVRRTVHDRTRVTPAPPDPAPPADPVSARLEGSLIAQAYLSLPERWRAVLWHTEVENARSADVAPLLGLSANGVAALAYRAREGLRQAYLQTYLTGAPPAECKTVLGKLGAYVRGGLTRRESRAVDEHVRDCPNCNTVLRELTDVTRGLRTVVGPLVLGAAATGYLEAIARTAPAQGPARLLGRLWGRKRLVAATGAGTVMAVAAAFAVVSSPDLAVRPTVAAHPRSSDPYDHVGPYGEKSPSPAASSGEPKSGGTVDPQNTTDQPEPGDRPQADAPALIQPRKPPDPTPDDEPSASEEERAGSASKGRHPGGGQGSASAGQGSGSAAGERNRVRARDKAEAPVPGAHRARLRSSVAVMGSLVRGEPGIVVMRLRNTGKAPTHDIYAAIELPPGVTLAPRTNPIAEIPRTTPHKPGTIQRVTERSLAQQGGSARSAAVPGEGGAVQWAAAVPEEGGAVQWAAARDAHGPEPREAGSPATRMAGGPGTREAGNPQAREAGSPEPRKAGSSGAREAGNGWRCQPVRGGARCAREPLAPGRATSVFLRVRVAGDAPFGVGPKARVEAGDLRLSARTRVGVRESGTPARFAADGKVTVRAVGNGLLTCEDERGCEEAARHDGDRLPLRPLDDDRSRRTDVSSAARLTLPKGGRIIWAGLYWSATADKAGPIKLKPPGRGRYVTVRPSEVAWQEMPDGPAYQAFADVTGLAATAAKSGAWWAADPPMTGPGHAGWSLVVVATDPAAPYGNALVLDEARVVGSDSPVLKVPLGGLRPAGAPARVELVTWEGDAHLGGDRVSLGAGPVTPEGGGRDAGNVFDGSANGTSAMTFGVDVDTLSDTLSARPRLVIAGKRDVVMFGAVAVSVPAHR